MQYHNIPILIYFPAPDVALGTKLQYFYGTDPTALALLNIEQFLVIQYLRSFDNYLFF